MQLWRRYKSVHPQGWCGWLSCDSCSSRREVIEQLSSVAFSWRDSARSQQLLGNAHLVLNVGSGLKVEQPQSIFLETNVVHETVLVPRVQRWAWRVPTGDCWMANENRYHGILQSMQVSHAMQELLINEQVATHHNEVGLDNDNKTPVVRHINCTTSRLRGSQKTGAP